MAEIRLLSGPNNGEWFDHDSRNGKSFVVNKAPAVSHMLADDGPSSFADTATAQSFSVVRTMYSIRTISVQGGVVVYAAPEGVSDIDALRTIFEP